MIIGAGGTLANTNGLNTNSLIDGQFLMVGDNGLKQNLSVPISGIAGVNYRFASIWKAQNTGNVGTVRIAWPAGLKALRLIQSPDAVFDSNDTVTDMSVNTQTVNGVTYNYADVTIGNGQFFTFAAFANAPGGVVNGLSQWYRADIDAVNTGNGSDVTSWTDYFAGTVSTQKGANALPKYRIGAADYFNFNPGLNFTAGTQTIGNNVVRTLTSLDFDVFTLTKEGMAAGGGNPRYFSVAQDNSGNSNNAIMDAFGLSPTGTVERRPIGGGTQFPGVNPAFSTTIPSIMYHKLTNTTAAKGLNGGALGTAETYAAQGEQFGGHYFGDTQFGSNGSDNRGFIGNIGETIVYGAGTLSDAERRKVDTYLAIKYGITLGRIATDNYVSSADAAIWEWGIEYCV
ncbi:hypothetical protein ACFOEQ_12355 [Chryseobacterium arachidis]|uniref:hypothetical protein n=1 Tax=Chryseobacterium arachidis TaxID=1416778 RepID=UPI0036170423